MSTSIIITLTPEQIQKATEVGRRRNEFNDSISKHHAYGFKGDGSAIHVEGAIGEMAVAVALKQNWTTFAENYESIRADVGNTLQVRATPHATGNLLLHPKDSAYQIWVLARLHALPSVELVGWTYGAKAKTDACWEAGKKKFPKRPCFLFPASNLNPMADLLNELDTLTIESHETFEKVRHAP